MRERGMPDDFDHLDGDDPLDRHRRGDRAAPPGRSRPNRFGIYIIEAVIKDELVSDRKANMDRANILRGKYGDRITVTHPEDHQLNVFVNDAREGEQFEKLLKAEPFVKEIRIRRKLIPS